MFLNLSFGQNSIKFNDYGFYHNELILLYSKAYMNNNTDFSKVSMNSIIEGMNLEIKKKYPTEFKDVDLNEVKNYYKNYDMADKYNFVENWDKNKTSYLSNGYLTKLGYEFIDSAIKNDLKYDDLLLKIQEIKRLKTLTDKDKIAFEVAESVLISSNELWNSNNSVALNKRNHCNGSIIVSDVGTAMMFAPAPYLSLFAGGFSSLMTAYTSNDCN